MYVDRKNLSVREWMCPMCRIYHNRDMNETKNIMDERLKQLHKSHITLIAYIIIAIYM